MGGGGDHHGGHGDHGHGGHGHGGHHNHFTNPLKRVWSPAGGWGNELHDWRPRYRLGLAVFFGVGVLATLTIGRNRERRFQQPLAPIPSQRLSKHTLEDTPDYLEFRQKWHENKPPLWQRILPYGPIDNPPHHHGHGGHGDHGEHH